MDNVNIYVADFKQKDVYDYLLYIDGPIDLTKWYMNRGITKINKGDIICFTGENPHVNLDLTPAYIIASEDYEIKTPSGSIANQDDMDHLQIPHGHDGTPQTQHLFVDLNYLESPCIWRSCNPSGSEYANELPWSFETKGVVTDYISLQWYEKYSNAGTLSLSVPATEDNIELFQPNRYLLTAESEKVMIIEGTRLNANLMADGYILQVTGRSLESILDRRVVFPGMSLNSSEYKSDNGLIKALYNVIDLLFIHPEYNVKESSDGTRLFLYPERKIPFLLIPEESGGDFPNRDSYIQRPYNASINKNILKESVLDVMSETCTNNNIGFKIIAEPLYGSSKCIVWRFILYTGQDKSYNRTNKTVPPLIFSPTLNNVKSVATTIDTSNYKNVIFCGTDKDSSDSYVDLTSTENQVANLLTINLPSVLSKAKDSIVSRLQETPTTYTGILICALAANHNDKDYSQTVSTIKWGNLVTRSYVQDSKKIYEVYPRIAENPQYNPTYDTKPLVIGIESSGKGINFGSPQSAITKNIAQQITITFKKTYGQDDVSSAKTDSFKVSQIVSELDGNNNVIELGFKQSTAFGWLTNSIMKEATSMANAMPSDWSSFGLTNLLDSVTKTTIIAWFRTFDQYTTSGVEQTKWLCQVYDRSNKETGLNRREVFVEQENDNDDDWDSSAIAAFKSSTTVIKTSAYNDDEDSDEEINEKLMESAKKQSGNFNAIRDVDVDIEYLAFKYMEDYNLGDIVQVDDGHNTLQTYMITGCTISNDTKDGVIIVPEFTKYEIVPPGYIQLEYLRVANMLLPVRYCPSEDSYGSNTDLDFKTAFPDIGPELVNNSYSYTGYINGILNERRSKWTEFEFNGGYIQYEHANPEEDQELQNNFALISAIGYDDQYGKHLMPYCLISSKITSPLKLGSPAATINAEYYTNERFFYQFIGDYSTREILKNKDPEPGNIYGLYACPGIGIKWETSISQINKNDYISSLYKVTDTSDGNIFYLNKPIISISNGINNIHNKSPELKYSLSYIGSEEFCISKRPQFQFAFVFDYNADIGYYDQISDWYYNYGLFGNDYENNPWTRNEIAKDCSTISYITPEEESGDEYNKYIFLNSEYDRYYVDPDMDPPTTNILLFKQGMGAYGQIPFNIEEVNGNTYYNNSYYRYIILGGYAAKKYESDNNIIWDYYTDHNNGVYIKNLKIYEYDSSFRINHYSKTKRDDPETEVNTYIRRWHGTFIGYNFKNVNSGTENVDVASRKLTHDYVPVKYIDYGEKEPETKEIYGLYDLIDNIFIPVNYCPDPEIFGESVNSHASFIDAGGEVPKY